jgi:hypothetical protein
VEPGTDEIAGVEEEISEHEVEFECEFECEEK